MYVLTIMYQLNIYRSHHLEIKNVVHIFKPSDKNVDYTVQDDLFIIKKLMSSFAVLGNIFIPFFS